MTKNTDPEKYSCSGYSNGFYACGMSSLLDNSGFGRNVNNSSSVYSDNRKNNIFIFSKDRTDRLDDMTFTAEAECSVNFSEQRKFICESLQYK